MAVKYFSEYKDPENVDYRIEISSDSFIGESTQIGAHAILEYPEIDDITDPIRGSSLKLILEADTTLTFEDIYTVSEQVYKITLTRNSQIIFVGWINPDGIYQDFVNDKWNIELDCSDGLAYLENLAYDTYATSVVTKRAKEILIIAEALKKTGLELDINCYTSFVESRNTPITGASTDGDFNYVCINQKRFIKDDNQTNLSCKEVLEAILQKYKAFITQYNGQWYIIDILTHLNESSINYYKYNYLGVYQGLLTHDNNFILGSQINGRYPHHCSGNQKIEISPSISAYRIDYDFGNANFSNTNPELNATDTGGGVYVIDGWNIDDATRIPQYVPDVRVTGDTGVNVKVLSTTDPTLNSISEGDSVEVFASWFQGLGVNGNRFKVVLSDGASTYYMTNSGSWSTSNAFIFTGRRSQNNIYKQVSNPSPIDGDITLEIFSPSVSIITVNRYVDWFEFSVGLSQSKSGIEGERYTFTKTTPNSSVIKTNEDAILADGVDDVYVSTLYINDGVTPTENWNYYNGPGFNLLSNSGLIVMDIFQRPQKVFSGDVYGYVDYLKTIFIDGLTFNGFSGNFVFLSYKFNTKTNIGEVKLKEGIKTQGSATFDVSVKIEGEYSPTI